MRKFYHLIFLFASLVSSPVWAQSVSKFPPSVIPTDVRVKQQPLKAPTAIDDKSKGVRMYAGEMTSYDKDRGWVTFTSNNTYEVIHLTTYENDPNYQTYGMKCGAWAGNKYYAYFCDTYDNRGQGGTLIENVDKFATIEPETGTPTTVHQYDASEYASWPILYAMSYDNSTKTLFALGESKMDGNESIEVSELYVIDTETGQWQSVMKFDKIYLEFAFDYDGNMYATTFKDDGKGNISGVMLDKLDENFKVVKSVECKLYGSSFISGAIGSMSFDMSTGDLYWLPIDRSNQKTLLLNTETGLITEKSAFYPSYCMRGLYIPYLTADSRTAAGRVSAIDAQADLDGAMKATVKWTNPTLAWNKSQLNELKEVLVYRKKANASKAHTTQELLSPEHADLLATVPANNNMGAAMQYVDDSPLAGINTYYVVPCRVSGEKGVPDSVRCFMGVDRPKAVTDINVQLDGEQFKVSWKAPEQGVNNGYIDQSALTYTVVRMPDSVTVATDTKQTSLVDTNPLTSIESYYYTIQPSNEAGKGEMAESFKVKAGPAVTPPVNFTFTTQADADKWDAVDASWSGRTFVYDEYYKALKVNSEAYANTNAWAISPKLKLEKGVTYRIVTDLQNSYAETPHTYHIAFGKSNTAEGMTEVIRTVEDESSSKYYDANRVQYEDTFTPDETGIYYYGFNIVTGEQDDYYLFGVKIEKVGENEMMAVGLTGVDSPVAGTANKATVKVTTLGSKPQSAYSVKIVQRSADGVQVVGETVKVPTIESGKTADIDIFFYPTAEGPFSFAGVVSNAQDTNPANDTTAFVSTTVQPEGTPTWTKVVVGADEYVDTHLPFSFFGGYSNTQTVYYKDEINAKAGGHITRIGYEYTAQDYITDRTDPSSIKIYMGHTDKEEWNDNEWLPSSDLQLVYDGQVAIDPGHNVLSFTLQTPFAYDVTKNLVVVVSREGSYPSGMDWPALFRVYNNVSLDWGAERSLAYADSSPFMGSGGYTYTQVPVLYLALDNAENAVKKITTSQESLVRYNASTGTLSFSGDVASARIYTTAGAQALGIAPASGQVTVAGVLAPGVYVVHVTTVTGQTGSLKITIGK